MTSLSHYLWLDVAVSAPERDALELLQHGAPTTYAVERTLTFEALPGAAPGTGLAEGAGAALRVDGGPPRRFAGALERAEWSYGHVHNTLMDGAHERGWHRLHAALLEVRGTGVIVAGHSGAGKTNLAVRAASRGAGIHSDEGVFLADGRAVGLPRRLHLKDSARGAVDPALFHGAARLDYPSPVWAVDAAAHWPLPALRPLDIGAIVLLGDPAAAPAARPVSGWQALTELATESAMFARQPERLVAELSRVVDRHPCLVLDGYFGARGAELIDALV
jgi:hypothetical protein